MQNKTLVQEKVLLWKEARSKYSHDLQWPQLLSSDPGWFLASSGSAVLIKEKASSFCSYLSLQWKDQTARVLGLSSALAWWIEPIKKIPPCTHRLPCEGEEEECCRKMCLLNKSKTCKIQLFSKYKFTILIQGYGYSSKEEPFWLDYVKAIIFKIHKKRKHYRIHSGIFPRSKPVCKYYVSIFNLLMLLESNQQFVLASRPMHHSLRSMEFSLLI